MTRFTPEAQDAARLPVALLGGFLGSGKTTLVNALLRRPEMAGTAVAINEFGAVPIDQHLIGEEGDRSVVLANGCLCCNLSGDWEAGVMRLFTRREAGALPRFERLIVEPSGLADPAPILQAMLRNPLLSRVLRLEAVVATVDAVFGQGQLAEHPEARAQVALADRLLLTKTDLAAPEAAALRAVLARLNPLAPVAEVRQGEADPAAIFPARFLGRDGPAPVAEWLAALPASRLRAEAVHGAETAALSLVSERAPDWGAFDAWLRRVRIEAGERLLRVKGLVGVPGQPGPVVVQGVQHVLHPPVALERWPGGDTRTRLVLITRDLPHAPLRAGWDALFAARDAA
ncbi:GTP-binding protein [Roseomonas sp. OT10]|uniref:CobW family GTP-binding protein n=1 Tax=Roseomonas cutis TaxID=2897332 RepID=UPI001E54772F|nr:GTP-binding protein [Roseomonas sp. OT10]UFN47143.1 GTP-binding protein [Roseomonas sp. OT10]